jgi:hypothetical protein
MNATVREEIDAPLKTRQHRLRHAQPGTTLGHHTHKVDANDRRVADTIRSMLSPGAETIICGDLEVTSLGPQLDPRSIKRPTGNLLNY